MADSTEDTQRHIAKVAGRITEITVYLAYRAGRHDASKFEPEEKPGYDIISEVLRGHAYGTDAYHEAMAAARKQPEVSNAITHHYAVNDHHPEYHADGVRGMSLLAILEMLADWKAASERSGGSMSLAFQVDRFGIGPELAGILEHTVKELGW